MGKSHLTEAHRSVIAQLAQAGCKLRQIGQLIGYAASTVSRELRRNANACGTYEARTAQRSAAARRSGASSWPHLGQALWDQVHALTVDSQAGPAQVAALLPVSAPAVYDWVYRRIAAGEDHLTDCLRQGHTQQRKRSLRQVALHAVQRRSIASRRAAVLGRKRLGHWEGDLVVSGDHQPSALLSLVERKSGVVLVRRVWAKTSAAVTRALIRALKPLARWVRSITTDNGSEFARWRHIEQALGCKVYASEPHKPWQRAIVEHTNGLIRQYFPKGSDAARLSAAAIQHMQAALNHRPRVRLLGGNPAQAFYDETGVAI